MVATTRYRIEGKSRFTAPLIVVENRGLGKIKVNYNLKAEQISIMFKTRSPEIYKIDFARNIEKTSLSLLGKPPGHAAMHDMLQPGDGSMLVISLIVFCFVICFVIFIARLAAMRFNDNLGNQLEMLPELLEKETEKRLPGNDLGKFCDGS